jgi:hypothetical protein
MMSSIAICRYHQQQRLHEHRQQDDLHPLRPRQHVLALREPLWREHLAILVQSPWINPADLIALEWLPGLRVLGGRPISTGGVPQRVEVHRDQHVAVVGLTAQDVTGDVGIVQPLHDDHDRRALVIEAVRHRLANEPDRLLTLQIALGPRAGCRGSDPPQRSPAAFRPPS